MLCVCVCVPLFGLTPLSLSRASYLYTRYSLILSFTLSLFSPLLSFFLFLFFVYLSLSLSLIYTLSHSLLFLLFLSLLLLINSLSPLLRSLSLLLAPLCLYSLSLLRFFRSSSSSPPLYFSLLFLYVRLFTITHEAPLSLFYLLTTLSFITSHSPGSLSSLSLSLCSLLFSLSLMDRLLYCMLKISWP